MILNSLNQRLRISKIEVSDKSGASLSVIRTNNESNWFIDKPLNTQTDSKQATEWLSKIVNLGSQEYIDNSESITASALIQSTKVLAKRFDKNDFIVIDFAESDTQVHPMRLPIDQVSFLRCKMKSLNPSILT